MQGLIDLTYTPHIKEILYELSPQSPTREIYFPCGTQVAKSTANLILIAYRIDCHLRGPILAMHAVKEMAVSWAKDELAETIEANKYISDVLERVGRKNDPYLFKKWPGASLIARGGASGTSYAKISAAVLLVDDADRFAMNIGGTTGKNKKVGEGNPLKLLLDRVSGRFGDYKAFINSSPRAEGESIIWPAFKKTDQNHFYVFCPKCNYPQVWEFENLVIPHKDYLITDEPYILCQNTDCGHKIYEDQKHKALQNAEYRPTAKGLDKLAKGYRVSSLYSLLGYPLEQYAKDWLSACKVYDEEGDNSEKIRHRNSKQARPWKRRVGKTIKHSILFDTRESLDPLPENCVILTAGVDVQDDRLECQVCGHGENDTYFIEHVGFSGDPRIKLGQEGSCWNQLEDFLLNKTYKNIHGTDQPIYSMAIDLGFLKEYPKDFIINVKPHYFQAVFGIFGKGSTAANINFIQNSTKDLDDFESWGLLVNVKKAAFYNLLERHTEGKGNLHFSDKPCFSERWFRQLTVEKPNDKGIFEKPHAHARNEALDCHIYSSAAFLLAFREYKKINWQSFIDWNKAGGTGNKSTGKRVISKGVTV
ncbi:MAG: phage terminase large subunit family protein [Victivallales bacterium]|nr:phage terminase large subunit family protein [Victivallales bacterium]